MAEKELSPEQKAKFTALMKKYRKESYKNLAIRMQQLATLKAEAEDEAKEHNAELDLIRLIIVPERFADDEITSLKIDGVGRLGLTSDMHCNVKKDDKEGFFNWMRENEFGDLIKEDINSSSLKALIKELGKSEDDSDQEKYEKIQDYVKVHPFMRASVTKT